MQKSHKSGLETELKLRIPATAPLRPRLEALGFWEVTPPQPERSVLWDRGGELASAGCALRTRHHAGEHRLTWKGARIPDPVLKIRPELETAVQDGQALEGVLHALGFSPVLVLEKVRAIWRSEALEACLDETPFGSYLELEGEAEAIRGALAQLGLSADQAEPRSYPELYRAHGLG